MGSACSVKKTTAVEKTIPVSDVPSASVASVDRTVENPGKKAADEPIKYTQGHLILEEVNTIIKAKALEAIHKDDSFIIKKLLRGGLRAYERVGNLQNNQTCLHVAAKLNSEKVLQDLLNWIDEQEPLKATHLLNLQDKDGNSPAILATYYDSDESLVHILNTGRVDLKLKNKKGQNIIDIAKAHSHNCEVIISTYILKHTKDSELNNLIEQPDKLEGKTINEIGERQPKGRSKLKKTTIITRKELEAKITLSNQDDNKVETITAKPDIKTRFEQILNMFEDKNASQVYFKDLQFSAETKSITLDTNHKYYKQYFENAQWLRASEIIGVDVHDVVLYDQINPNDISQGLLGVCYFLAAVSSLAEYPSRLMSVINNKKANPFGVYSVTLYMAGVPKEIIVDDFFPCFQSGKPLFSRPKGNEIWVLILEKAWAKAFGNYIVTESGWIDEALAYLLGAPTDQIVIDEDSKTDDIWNQLMLWDRERYIMGCATRSTVKKEDGLVPNHAYTILSVHNVSGYRLVKLRNPWGKFEWNGDFSDGSKLWADPIKQEVGFSNEDDGVFVMKLEDFMKYFEYYTGCFYKDKYVRGRAVAENVDGKADYYEIVVEKESFVNIEVHQTDKRLLQDQKKKESDYRPVEMILCKKEGDEFKKISNYPRIISSL